MDENRDKKRLDNLYRDASKRMSELNKRIKVIQYRNIDPQKKRDEIDRLTQAKIKLARITEERRVSRESASQAQE
jgi:hypothetical protein